MNSNVYEHGEIYISVGEEDTDPIFYGNSYSEIEDFSLTIPHDGCYTITCSGKMQAEQLHSKLNSK